MTDAEFLDELQRVASRDTVMFITNDEWKRLEEISGPLRLCVVPGAGNTWALDAGEAFREITRARLGLAERVKQRLLGQR